MLKNKPFLPAVIFAAVMLVGYSLPTDKLERIKESRQFFDTVFSDFSLHFFLFALFVFLLGYGFVKRYTLKWSFLSAGLLSFGYGILIELWQHVLPYRTFKIDDILNNFFGILFGLLILWGILIIYHKSREKY